tara:strand:+ start:732 stop:1442 length:711 start_codon:yes stop_codon:yes gene_type:complete
MSEKYYISSDIYFDLDKKCFFKDLDEDICLKINNTNFEVEFEDYGWSELGFLWNIELGDQFMLLDCGANGDCLFHCLSEAINLDNICRGDISNLFDVQTLRTKASNEFTSENFDLILQNYKIEKEVGEFQGDWDPESINSIEELQNELCKTGNNFWGDHIIIQLLSQSIKKNIIVLNGDEEFEKLTYNTVETPGSKGYIIIYFENNCHYKLVGKFNGKKIVSVFPKIPDNLLTLEN